MITNTYISLDPNSQIRMDALNTIKYTLMLDYRIPELNNRDNLIDNIMNNCQICCDGLFREDHSLPDTFNFFGSLPLGKKPDPLFYLNYIRPSSKLTSIPSMILHHCILSSYHAILTELLQNYRVSSYAMVNNIKTYGFQSLKKNGMVLLKDNRIKFKGQKDDIRSSKKSSLTSDFIRVVNSHKKIDLLSNIMKLMINSESEDSSNYNYSLQFSELCYRICQIKAPSWKRIKVTSKLEAIKNTAASIEPHDISLRKICIKNNFNGNRTDTLYHYYLTERIFNFSLFFSLLENIKQIESKTNYRLDQEYIIPILCLCKELPNVFSRQVFLKYAFGQIESKPESYSDFWLHNNYEKRYSMVELSRYPKGFHFHRWIEQYKLFFKYLSSYIIPIYEWCFINMLLESIEQSSPNGTHFENLSEALDLLNKYMEKNGEAIMHPIQSEKDVLDFIKQDGYDILLKQFNKDGIKQIIHNKGNVLDVITEHKNYLYLESLSKDSIEQIISNLLLSSEDLELNLPALNPNFFKNDKAKAVNTNSSFIRKFYLDLIYSTYLE